MAGTVAGTGRALGGHWAGTVWALDGHDGHTHTDTRSTAKHSTHTHMQRVLAQVFTRLSNASRWPLLCSVPCRDVNPILIAKKSAGIVVGAVVGRDVSPIMSVKK